LWVGLAEPIKYKRVRGDKLTSKRMHGADTLRANAVINTE